MNKWTARVLRITANVLFLLGVLTPPLLATRTVIGGGISMMQMGDSGIELIIFSALLLLSGELLLKLWFLMYALGFLGNIIIWSDTEKISIYIGIAAFLLWLFAYWALIFEKNASIGMATHFVLIGASCFFMLLSGVVMKFRKDKVDSD